MAVDLIGDIIRRLESAKRDLDAEALERFSRRVGVGLALSGRLID